MYVIQQFSGWRFGNANCTNFEAYVSELLEYASSLLGIESVCHKYMVCVSNLNVYLVCHNNSIF